MSETSRLLVGAQAGERSALNGLFALHQGRLLAFIRLHQSQTLRGRLAPEDVLQETLLEAARKVGEFEPEGPSAFYRWLLGIARFKLSEAERAQRAFKRSNERPLQIDPAHEQTSPSGLARQGERADRLHVAIGLLPERQAEAVRLRYLQALSLAETAERLQCSEAAVKSLVSRGMVAMAGHLDQTAG
ncbi:MAG TPA: RNA polymerase sigma factor [Planctomycetota bacterium]|nr:RNA polymerase sigma factor [Planctomycetota bacterium]